MDYKRKLEEALVLLTEDKVKEILIKAGAVIVEDTSEFFILNTICHHGGNSNKLYYYKENKAFMCYTNCGFMPAIDLFKKIWNVNFYEAVDILRGKLGLAGRGFGQNNTVNDFKESVRESVDILESMQMKSRDRVNIEEYNPIILERYEKIYKLEWLMDGISSKAMGEFGIRYCYTGDRVIIPHYDIENRLIGIRSRNFGEEAIEHKMKYTPLFVENTVCSHPLGFNLYGINKNKDNIRRKKEVVLVEGEKGVLQAETFYGRENNITVAVCGSNISKYQRDMLLKLDIEKVYIGFDKQWENKDTEEYENWVVKIEKIVHMFSAFVEVVILWDDNNLLQYKDSPYDRGYKVTEKLFEKAHTDIMSLKEYQIRYEESEEIICSVERDMGIEKYLLSVGVD